MSIPTVFQSIFVSAKGSQWTSRPIGCYISSFNGAYSAELCCAPKFLLRGRGTRNEVVPRVTA